jgi:hypothetical protein
MDYLIVAVFVGTISFVIGISYGKFLLIKRMIDLLTDKELAELESVIKTMENKVDVIVKTVLKQEVVNGTVYLYDSHGNFICQGNTTDEAAQRYGEIDSGEAIVECADDNRYNIVAGKVVV